MTGMFRATAIVAILVSLSAGAEQRPRMYVVHLPIHSYRLLAMSMDDNGDIWFGSIHHVVHRYNPRTGAVDTIPLPKTTDNYKFWASQSLPLNNKVYFLGEAYPNLLIYDPVKKTFTEKPYPSPKPDVWYGIASPDKRHLYLFDRGGVGLIKWDTQTETGTPIPYPYQTLMPSFGAYDPRDDGIWAGIWDYTNGKYLPIAIARLDVKTDSFSGIWYTPTDDADLRPCVNPEKTRYYAWTLKGKLMPFDIQEKRWCKFLDVPGLGSKYGFIGIGTPFKGHWYFSLSTYAGHDDPGIDGNQYHFLNSILDLDPSSGRVNFLTLNITGKYYQIAYMLSARGAFYATGSNVRLPDGRIVRENKGDIIVWQTQPLEHSSPKSVLRLSNARRDGS
jgi:streptogramin lyase